MAATTTPPERLLEAARHYIRTLTLNDHQIGSFEWFADHTAATILDGFDPITCTDVITNICTHIPPDTETPPRPDVLTIRVATRDARVVPSTQEPSECLSRQIDYVCTLLATVRIEIRLRTELVWQTEYPDFRLGWLPAMVLSRQCKVGVELRQLEQQWMRDANTATTPAASLDPSVRERWRHARHQLMAQHRLDMSEIGGYFIARGAEKVVVVQERLTNSSVYVFPPDDKETIGVVRYDKPIIGECRSHNTKLFKQEMFSLTWSAVPNRPVQVIRAVLPKFKMDFPLFILLRALLPLEPAADLPTFQTADEVARLLMMFCTRPDQAQCYHDLTLTLEHSEREAHGISSTRQALYYMGQRCKLPEVTGDEELTRSLSIQQTILKEIFPHLTDSPLLSRYSPVPTKLHFMLFMLYRLLSVVLKWELFDDRDHYGNKRMDTTGTLLKLMYRHIMIRQTREVQKLVVTSCKGITQKKSRVGGRGGNSVSTSVSVSTSASTSTSAPQQTFAQLLAALQEQLSRATFERWWTPQDARGKYVMGIQKEFSVALVSGNWNKNAYASAVASSVVMRSISQYFKRSNYISQIAEQRRISLPVSKNSTNTRPRHVHTSQWGVVDPSQTPEDENVGFLKHMALACCCSRPLDVDSIHQLLLNEIVALQVEEPVDRKTLLPVPLTWVTLNGNILGAVPFKRRMQLYVQVRRNIKIAIRANHMLGVSLQRMGRILQVQTDEGRCCRPLVVLQHIDQWLTTPHFGMLSFEDMISRGWLEWLDVAETMMHAVASDWTFLNSLLPSERSQYNYLELHPSLIAGFSSAIIPYANMNPGPRVSYAASMAASGIGMYGTNIHLERDDSLYDNLDYPQKSLTPTTWAKEAFLDELPTFQNAVVAILSYGGNNQEDAVIVNQSAVDFGMFRSTRYRSFRDSSSCQSSATKEYLARQRNQFGVPVDLSMRPPSVDADGLAMPGFEVHEGDVLMHKVIIKEKVRLVDDVSGGACGGGGRVGWEGGGGGGGGRVGWEGREGHQVET